MSSPGGPSPGGQRSVMVTLAEMGRLSGLSGQVEWPLPPFGATVRPFGPFSGGRTWIDVFLGVPSGKRPDSGSFFVSAAVSWPISVDFLGFSSSEGEDSSADSLALPLDLGPNGRTVPPERFGVR